MKSTKNLVKGAVIGAFYAVLTLAFAPISFGAVQFRISEALCILPIFTPAAIPGLFVGCLISNLIGVAAGANIMGIMDVALGSLATLCAALLVRALKNVKLFGLPVLSLLLPIIINALVIGAEMAIAYPTDYSFLFGLLTVAAGQTPVMILLGIPLYFAIEKTRLKEIVE